MRAQSWSKMAPPKPRRRSKVLNYAKRGQKRLRYDDCDEIESISETNDTLNTSFLGDLDIDAPLNQSCQADFKTYSDQQTQTQAQKMASKLYGVQHSTAS